MLLSGYGVELAIKSTEYKAVDDTQVKGLFVHAYSVLKYIFNWCQLKNINGNSAAFPQIKEQ